MLHINDYRRIAREIASQSNCSKDDICMRNISTFLCVDMSTLPERNEYIKIYATIRDKLLALFTLTGCLKYVETVYQLYKNGMNLDRDYIKYIDLLEKQEMPYFATTMPQNAILLSDAF